jgi:hypothetical protein
MRKTIDTNSSLKNRNDVGLEISELGTALGVGDFHVVQERGLRNDSSSKSSVLQVRSGDISIIILGLMSRVTLTYPNRTIL